MYQAGPRILQTQFRSRMPALKMNRAYKMTNQTVDRKQERRNRLLQIFRDYGDRIAPALRESILAEKIVLGMTPYDAHLAGGAFAFKVIADPAKWEKNADPYKVMWAQSINTDESQIWMTFENNSQYSAEGKQYFQVFFKNGKAVEITKLARPK